MSHLKKMREITILRQEKAYYIAREARDCLEFAIENLRKDRWELAITQLQDIKTIIDRSLEAVKG